MDETLRSWLHSLKSGRIDTPSFIQIVDYFVDYSSKTAFVAANRTDVAMVFYELLLYCQNRIIDNGNIDNLSTDLKLKILTSFSNIEKLFLEASEHDRCSSYVQTIWFLSELKDKAANKRISKIDLGTLRKYSENLLDVLENISFIFDLSIEKNRAVFPINKVIAYVIKGHDFLSAGQGIKMEDVRILQLAVRLFKAKGESQVLQELIGKYNLKFIEYLSDSCEIIDTADLLNYQKNGVMVFHDSEKKRILIRSESEEYFKKSGEFGHELHHELDKGNNKIGWFIEYPLESDDKLTDYSVLMDNEDGRISILKLLFNQCYLNVFVEHSIIEKADGSIRPINSYCYQDEFVVKGRLGDRQGKSYSVNDVRALLNDYRLCSVKSDNINRVTFGFCSLLLELNNTGFESLGLDRLNNSSWYQEQVLINWLQDEKTKDLHILSLLNEWCNQLSSYETDGCIQKNEIHVSDFLPLALGLKEIRNKLFPKLLDDEQILVGRVIDEDGYCIEVRIRGGGTVSSKKLKKELQVLDVPVQQIVSEGTKWEDLKDSDVFFFYSNCHRIGHFFDSDSVKHLAFIELINENCLHFDIAKLIPETQFKKIKDRMGLFKPAYSEMARAKRICMEDDFETQAFVRLVNNLIWSKVTSGTIADYYSTISKHQIVGFKGIGDDSFFLRKGEGVLYVPKDSDSSCSVLYDVYTKYLKEVTERDSRYLYDNKIEKDPDGHYRIHGAIIQTIVFLTDNFIGGVSTISALKAYLGMDTTEDRVKQSIATMHHYYCDGKEVTIKDILDSNEDISVVVHGYYGTDYGCSIIDGFLSNRGIKHGNTSYAVKLDTDAGQMIKVAKRVWPSLLDSRVSPSHKLFIREFSMPKVTLLPPGVVGNLNYSYTLFPRRDEFDQTSKKSDAQVCPSGNVESV